MSRAKTLVTGATGMTGSHTVQLRLKRGHTVRVLAHNEDDRSMRVQALGAEGVRGQYFESLNLVSTRPRFNLGPAAIWWAAPSV